MMSEIPVVVRIREVATRKEFDYHTSVDEKYADGQRFYYEDGNGSCDCNRKLMFGYAQETSFSDEETPCGQSRYLVRVMVGERVVLDELEGQ